MLLSPHQPSSKFKEICNVLEIIKLLAIHTGIRFREPTAYICLYHAYQNQTEFLTLYVNNYSGIAVVYPSRSPPCSKKFAFLR